MYVIRKVMIMLLPLRTFLVSEGTSHCKTKLVSDLCFELSRLRKSPKLSGRHLATISLVPDSGNHKHKRSDSSGGEEE